MARKRPGTPLPYWDNPYRPVSGSRGTRYFNIHTGNTVSRGYYFDAHARAFGFKDNADYIKFSRQFAGGLGGLGGLKIVDVKRVKAAFDRYERENHLPKGTIGDDPQGRSVVIWAKGFLEEQDYFDRTRFVTKLMDSIGIPNYTKAFFAVGSPPQKA